MRSLGSPRALRTGDSLRLHCLLIGVPGVTYKEALLLSIAFVKQGLTDGRQIVKLRHNTTLMQAIADSVGLSGFSHHRLHEIVRKIVKSGLVKQPRPRRPRRPRSSSPPPRRRTRPSPPPLPIRDVGQRPKLPPKLSFRDFETPALAVIANGGEVYNLLN